MHIYSIDLLFIDSIFVKPILFFPGHQFIVYAAIIHIYLKLKSESEIKP